MAKENAKSRYNAKYMPKNIKAFTLKLNVNTDQQMIEWLSTKEKYSQYIKALIAEDMKKSVK